VGGVETIVNDLCRELPKRGWDATLALGKGSRFNDVNAYRAAYPDLPITEIDGTKGTRQGRLEAVTTVIERLRPDVVLSARIFDAYEAVTEYKKHQPNLRLAVTIQVYEPHYLYDLRAYRHSVDCSVTSGNLIRQAVMKWARLAEDRVVSIPGGVSPPAVPIEPRDLKSLTRLGYVGRLDQVQKRILDVEPLLRDLDKNAVNFTLDVIGTGPCEVELSQQLAGWIANGRVKFHGWQSKERLYGEFFPNMDCFIHFAHSEGITIAPREAMAHGIVPVISQFAGLRAEQHFVHEYNCLTFPVGDFAQAAANIKRLISEPGLFRALSRNALASQTGKYTFAGSMDAWAEAFNRCMEQPAAVGSTPNLNFPADGRLTRFGLSPRVAQRVRDLFGKCQIHNDPGSEWPTGSGLITPEVAEEILQFGRDYDNGREVAADAEANVARSHAVEPDALTAKSVVRIGLDAL
jgi:glycosyltransferase involved in cell wall biosynthesis